MAKQRVWRRGQEVSYSYRTSGDNGSHRHGWGVVLRRIAPGCYEVLTPKGIVKRLLSTEIRVRRTNGPITGELLEKLTGNRQQRG